MTKYRDTYRIVKKWDHYTQLRNCDTLFMLHVVNVSSRNASHGTVKGRYNIGNVGKTASTSVRKIWKFIPIFDIHSYVDFRKKYLFW